MDTPMETKNNPGDSSTPADATVTAADNAGFCPWYPLARAGEHVPGQGSDGAPGVSPGVFQIRVRTGLLAYPRGKSAMIHYGHDADLRAAVLAFATLHPERDWLCRHISCATAAAAAALHTQILDRFTARFGTSPRPPRAEDEAGRHR